jgi:hypothetical protein
MRYAQLICTLYNNYYFVFLYHTYLNMRFTFTMVFIGLPTFFPNPFFRAFCLLVDGRICCSLLQLLLLAAYAVHHRRPWLFHSRVRLGGGFVASNSVATSSADQQPVQHRTGGRRRRRKAQVLMRQLCFRRFKVASSPPRPGGFGMRHLNGEWVNKSC